ncbi:MAG TPA: DUF2846 domain-containing protein [Candidatus Acidoferrales bacterium]|nr:DUF2846 domain-containing protein [Candidatus Acidoferrales bacterium]
MRSSSIVPLFAGLILLSPNSFAQSGPGCGPANLKFDVKTTNAEQPAPTPQAGKALVYFLQDDLKYDSSPRPTTRFAIDGLWLGATHANSYFYVFVDPGEHHLCANWQSDVILMNFGVPKRSTSAASFTAESGKTYYFRAQDIAKSHSGENNSSYVSEAEVLLAPLDGDEAQVLMNTFSFSSSHPKK